MGEVLLFLLLQIFFESLPISSSGHMELIGKIGGFLWTGPLYNEAIDFFSHGATVVVLMVFFFEDWWPIMRRLFWRTLWNDSYRALWKIVFRIAWLTIVAGVGTASCYWILKLWIKQCAWFDTPWMFFYGFVVTMVALLSLKKCEDETEVLTTNKAIMLGFIQGVALLPGISRFAVTYVAARWMKISKRRSLQISFLIQFFLILAGSVKGVIEVSSSRHAYLLTSPSVWLVILIGSIFALLALYVVKEMINRDKFWIFGIYEAIPVAVALWYAVYY